MNKYVSARDLIQILNEITHAIYNCEEAINQLDLGNLEHDFEGVWRDLFEFHFADCKESQDEVAKIVLESLINALCLRHCLSLVSEEDFSPSDNMFSEVEQYELDF